VVSEGGDRMTVVGADLAADRLALVAVAGRRAVVATHVRTRNPNLTPDRWRVKASRAAGRFARACGAARVVTAPCGCGCGRVLDAAEARVEVVVVALRPARTRLPGRTYVRSCWVAYALATDRVAGELRR
jgi:hypothetical protein